MNAERIDVLTVKSHSVIVKSRNGDCTILDYYRNGEIYSDGPYSLAVAKYLRPGAELREVGNAIRHRHQHPTEDMLDRTGAH